jgi:hypothetical protein
MIPSFFSLGQARHRLRNDPLRQPVFLIHYRNDSTGLLRMRNDHFLG